MNMFSLCVTENDKNRRVFNIVDNNNNKHTYTIDVSLRETPIVHKTDLYALYMNLSSLVKFLQICNWKKDLSKDDINKNFMIAVLRDENFRYEINDRNINMKQMFEIFYEINRNSNFLQFEIPYRNYVHFDKKKIKIIDILSKKEIDINKINNICCHIRGGFQNIKMSKETFNELINYRYSSEYKRENLIRLLRIFNNDKLFKYSSDIHFQNENFKNNLFMHSQCFISYLFFK